MPIDFRYVPVSPEPISGISFIDQTERAINELGANYLITLDTVESSDVMLVEVDTGLDHDSQNTLHTGGRIRAVDPALIRSTSPAVRRTQRVMTRSPEI